MPSSSGVERLEANRKVPHYAVHGVNQNSLSDLLCDFETQDWNYFEPINSEFRADLGHRRVSTGIKISINWNLIIKPICLAMFG